MVTSIQLFRTQYLQHNTVSVADPGGQRGRLPPPPILILQLFPSPFYPVALICWTPPPNENPGSAPALVNNLVSKCCNFTQKK